MNTISWIDRDGGYDATDEQRLSTNSEKIALKSLTR